MTAVPVLRAVVIYDTRYGNTARVAEALVRGLNRSSRIEAQVSYAPETQFYLLEISDLVVVGGPTEGLRESRHLRDFFGRMGAYDLHGKYGFAFDTHSGAPLHGGAAHGIDVHLRAMGLEMLRPVTSAVTVMGPESSSSGGPSKVSLHLAPGTEAQFEEIGVALGRSLLEAVERHHQEIEREMPTAQGIPVEQAADGEPVVETAHHADPAAPRHRRFPFDRS